MSFKDLMTYICILIRHIYTSVISWWTKLIRKIGLEIITARLLPQFCSSRDYSWRPGGSDGGERRGQCVCKYTYIYIHYIYMHVYIRTYKHTHTHIHIYIYICIYIVVTWTDSDIPNIRLYTLMMSITTKNTFFPDPENTMKWYRGGVTFMIFSGVVDTVHTF